MSDATITSLAAGVVAIVTAIGSVLIALINAKLNKAEKKADTIIEKATEIHALTNGSLSKVQATLETSTEKILGLEKLIAAMTAANAATVAKDALHAAAANVPPAKVSKASESLP